MLTLRCGMLRPCRLEFHADRGTAPQQEEPPVWWPILTGFIFEIVSPVVILTLVTLDILGDIEWSATLKLFMTYGAGMQLVLLSANMVSWILRHEIGVGSARRYGDVTGVNRSAAIAAAPGSSARLSKRKATYIGGCIQSIRS